MKKILFIILTLIAISCSFLVGCSNNGGGQNSGTEETLLISNNKKTVGKFDSVELSVKSKKEGTVTFKVEDESIAKIIDSYKNDNGNFVAEILGLKAGQTKVTASLGDKKISCTITVEESVYYPSIEINPNLEKFNIGIDSEVGISARIVANGFEISKDVVWTIKDAENSEVAGDEIISFENGMVKGLKEGSAILTASYEFEGSIISKNISVEVKPNIVVAFNASKVDLATVAEAGDTEFDVALESIYYNQNVIEISKVQNIKYSSSNEDIILVDENTGKITSIGRGQAFVVADITLDDGAKIVGSVAVSVAPYFKSENIGEYALNDAENMYKDFVYEAYGNKIIEVVVSDSMIEQEYYSIKDGKVSIAYDFIKKYYGKDNFISIKTDKADYEIGLDIVTCLITDWSQISTGDKKVMAPIYLAGGATTYSESSSGGTATDNWNGYFVLGNDIDAKGEALITAQTMWVASKGYGFKGTLDGKGYTIKNFKTSSNMALFGGITKEAIIKNLNITGYVNNGGSGLFGWYFNGNYDNLYIEGESYGNGVLGAEIEEVTFTNSIVVVTACPDDAFAFSKESFAGGTTGSAFYADSGKLAEGFEVKPLTIMSEVNTEGETIIGFDGIEKIFYQGEDITSLTGITISDLEVSFDYSVLENRRGLFELKSGKLTRYFIGDFNLEKEVKSVKLFAGQQTNDIGNIVENIYTVEVDGAIARVLVSSDEGKTGYYLTDNDYELDQANNVLNIKGLSLVNAGLVGYNKTLIVETYTTRYTINFDVFSNFAVTKASDFDANSSSTANAVQTAGGYKEGEWGKGIIIVLANDIDFKGEPILSQSLNYWKENGYGFKGTIDGLGNAIYNYTITGQGGALVDTIAGGVIQNVRFINFKQSGSCGISGWYNGLVIKNCYIDITSVNYFGGKEKITGPSAGYAAMYDCFIISRDADGGILNDAEVISSVFKSDKTTTVLGDGYVSKHSNSSWNDEKGRHNEEYLNKLPYAENKLQIDAVIGADAVVEIANVTKVLKDGKDITSLVDCGETSATFSSNVWDESSTFVVISEDKIKIVNFEVNRELETLSRIYGTKQSNNLGEIIVQDFIIESDGTLESATIDGAVVEASQEGNVITIPASEFDFFAGKTVSVEIKATTIKYVIEVKVADFLVTKASDLTGGRTTANPMMQALGCSDSTGKTTGYNWGGYILLANDIDFGGATVYFGGAAYNASASVTYGFAGTIDGNGYALKNFTFGGSNGGWGAMFGNFRSGTIKDLSILNAKQQFFNNEGLLFLKAVATLENCYFDIEAAGTGNGFILCGQDRDNRLIIRNSVFIVRTGARDTSKSALIGTYTSNLVSNTVVFSDYAEAEGLKTALGEKFVGYAENKLEVNVSAGANAVVEVANVARVLKDGKDITSLVTIGDNVTIPSSLVDANSTYVVLGDTYKIVNVVIA